MPIARPKPVIHDRQQMADSESSNATAERPADEPHREKADAYAHRLRPARHFPPKAEHCGAASQSDQWSDNVELKLSVDWGTWHMLVAKPFDQRDSHQGQ